MGEQDETANMSRNRYVAWVRNNFWKILITIGVIYFLVCWLIWLQRDEVDMNTLNDSGVALILTNPVQLSEPLVRDDWRYNKFTINADLSYQLPDTWTSATEITGGVNEFVQLRSPVDKNNFYYCLDLREYSSSTEVSLSAQADVVTVDRAFTADGIGKPLNLINYVPSDGSNGFYTTVIDNTAVSIGNDVEFDESITNPTGRRLRVLGQLNCDGSADFSVSQTEYTNSQHYLEAHAILSSIAY